VRAYAHTFYLAPHLLHAARTHYHITPAFSHHTRCTCLRARIAARALPALPHLCTALYAWRHTTTHAPPPRSRTVLHAHAPGARPFHARYALLLPFTKAHLHAARAHHRCACRLFAYSSIRCDVYLLPPHCTTCTVRGYYIVCRFARALLTDEQAAPLCILCNIATPGVLPIPRHRRVGRVSVLRLASLDAQNNFGCGFWCCALRRRLLPRGCRAARCHYSRDALPRANSARLHFSPLSPTLTAPAVSYTVPHVLPPACCVDVAFTTTPRARGLDGIPLVDGWSTHTATQNLPDIPAYPRAYLRRTLEHAAGLHRHLHTAFPAPCLTAWILYRSHHLPGASRRIAYCYYVRAGHSRRLRVLCCAPGSHHCTPVPVHTHTHIFIYLYLFVAMPSCHCLHLLSHCLVKMTRRTVCLSTTERL